MVAKTEQGRKDLQEVYLHLDHCDWGNRYIAYYGQLRAEGYDHKEALEQSIEYFGLKKYDWYKSRMEYCERKDIEKAKFEERRKEQEKTQVQKKTPKKVKTQGMPPTYYGRMTGPVTRS